MHPLLLTLLLAAAPGFEEEIRVAIADVATVYPVPASLVRAVIRQESAFNAAAVSPMGAIGLMQVMPFNATRLGVREADLVRPAINILAGVRLLAVLLKHYRGDVIAALVAYNSGPKPPAVIPNNGETPEYVLRILRYWRDYQAAEAALRPAVPSGSARGGMHLP